MKWWRAALLACVVGGCITIKPFKPCPVPATDVCAQSDDTGTSVTAPTYKVHFASGDFAYPDRITIGSSANMITTGSLCNDEALAGVAMYPSFVAAASSQVPQSSSQLTVDLRGPGVAKITIDWSVMLMCGGASGTPSGRSRFTFFADGRVARWDHVDYNDSALDPSACRCATGGLNAWVVSSFLTLNRPATAVLTGAQLPSTTGDMGTTAQQQGVCLDDGNNHQLAAAPLAASFFRVRASTSQNVALVEDGAMVSSLMNVSLDFQSAWRLSDQGSCGNLATAVVADLSPPDVVIDGNSTGLQADGIYGGETMNGVGYPVSTDTVTISAQPSTTVPAGSAVWLSFESGPHSHFTVTGITSDAYVIQQPSAAPDQLVIWFRDQITDSSNITIIAQ